MKLTPRQKQIAVLRQRGAKDKEIALVLGIEIATVKSHVKAIREKCLDYGVDIFAVPLERDKRITFLADLARVEYYKQKFGETCE
jgi:uncharacterized protein YerC